MVLRQSDSRIVPMMKGNAFGGKAATSGYIRQRNPPRTQRRVMVGHLLVGESALVMRHQSDEEPDAGKPHVRFCRGVRGVIPLSTQQVISFEFDRIDTQKDHLFSIY